MKTIKKICIICLGWMSLVNSPMKAQTEQGRFQTPSFGIEKNMPSFYLQAREDLTYPMAWGNAPQKNFNQWRKEARKVLFDCMGNLPAPAQHFDTEILAREQRDGYEAQKIAFTISSYCRIPAYLLIPDGAKDQVGNHQKQFPAVVVLHDHGAKFTIGKEKMIRPLSIDSSKTAEAIAWSKACYDEVFVGDYFAKNGYVVLCIDALFWGERGRKEGADYDVQQALAANMFQLGMSWFGLIIFDDIQSVEYLSSLPFVDKNRIGAIGHSMGGHRAWTLAAATDKVKAAVSVCWMNTTEHLMTINNNQNKGGSAYSMLLPEIRRYMDYPHVACIACPKPIYFINGDADKLFPLPGVESAYKTMHQLWDSQHAGDKLKTEIFHSPHYFNREMQANALLFFNEFMP